MENEEKRVNTLLVENDPGDQKLIKGTISADCRVRIEVVPGAEEALEYLQNGLKDSLNYPRPDLILLDLNMPGMGGREFLKVIKADADFSSIPVVIVTTSDSPDDIQNCYALHAAGYIQKTASPEEFSQILQKLAHYWFLATAKLNY